MSQHPACIAQRSIGVGEMTHAESVDDGIEGFRIEWQRLGVALFEPYVGVPLASRANLSLREIDPDRIGSALFCSRRDVACARRDI
jgi:hypothetical protein